MKREEYLSSLPSSSSLFNACSHTSIGAQSWLVAEQSAQEILSTIQPTVASEHMRNEVIGYLQSLIGEYFGTEVLPFGSVPLKTYLPDGDIDLTVVCHQNTEEDLARDICSFLEREEQKDTEFVIKKVEYIPAQVRLVKCNVQDIAVDISFNQMAGLSALCFLERVDQFTGKDHLFKCSIILIKAWCYYESRILGALYGLMSTYALDLLVLHIVNLFHSSVNGPLSVLFRFLNYYSTFDWDRYCVSLNGPVAISSLPKIMVETPQNDGSGLLLSQEFLKNETDIFSVSTWAFETSEQAFPVKHLNIIDPLKENNNLGRSVCKANFYRIKCAFTYGARKLGEIIMLPPESIGEGLKKFFVTTLNRNGMGRRQDVRVPVPVFGAGKPEVSDLSVDYNSYFTNLMYVLHFHNQNSSIQFGPPTSPLQLIWNQSAGLQLNQNFLSLTNMEGFVPGPFCHPNVAQPSSSALGDEEILMVQGTGTCIPTVSVEEKLNSQGMMSTYIPNMKSRGTGPFIPDIRVEKMSQGTARCIFGMDFKEKVKSKGTFIPKKVVEEKEKMLQGTARCSLGMDVDEKKLKGKGTFISDKGVEETNKSQGAVTKIPDMGVEEKYQPGGTAMYIPNVGVDKNAESQGTGIYNHDSVEEKVKLKGKGTFIPDQDVEEKNKPQGALTKIPDKGVEEKSQPGGTATYIPNVGVEVNPESQVTGIYNHDMGVEENIKSQGEGKQSSDLRKSPNKRMGVDKNAESQGTGIYNHDMGVEVNTKSQGEGKQSSDLTESPKKQMHIWGKERDDRQTTQGLMLISSSKNEQVNVSSVTKEESSSCLCLSLEEFPPLSTIKKAKPSKTLEPDQPTVESPQAENSSTHSEMVEFGFFGPALSPLILPSTIADSEPPESSEHKEERIPVQPYKLEDDEDFPPLSR